MVKKLGILLVLLVVLQGNISAKNLEKEVNLLKKGFSLLVKKVTKIEEELVQLKQFNEDILVKNKSNKPVIEIVEVNNNKQIKPRHKLSKRMKKKLELEKLGG